MSTQKEKQLDCLGFDRMQLAAIKRNYQNNKPLYVKMNKLAKKINAAIEEHHQLQADAAASDLYTRNLAKRVTGYDLTSDAVLDFHANPEAWEKFKAEHPLNTSDKAPTEEPSKPADGQPSGDANPEAKQPAEPAQEAAEQPADEGEVPDAFGE
jgi:hypothetical protein